MITVSLINELRFLAGISHGPIYVTISYDSSLSLNLSIVDDYLEVDHKGEKIWRESLNHESGNFGIESCQQISAILAKKSSGAEYNNLIYWDE
jgi:hypothetical protein